MAAGFAVGSIIFPGIGSIIGAVAGAIGGTIAGEKLSMKAYAKIEKQIQDMELNDQRLKEWMEGEEEKYQQSLFILKATEMTSLKTI